MNWYLKVMNQYADFSGRARRKEYWMYTLFYCIALIIATILDKVLGLNFTQDLGYGVEVEYPYGWIYILVAILHFIPSLAVSVRRLHDVGKSGWMLLVSLIPLVGGIWLLVLFCMDSNSGENKYGGNPKEIAS